LRRKIRQPLRRFYRRFSLVIAGAESLLIAVFLRRLFSAENAFEPLPPRGNYAERRYRPPEPAFARRAAMSGCRHSIFHAAAFADFRHDSQFSFS